MPSTHDLIIQAACTLLEKQGYPATSLDEIVKESGATKGSLYYYFPDGKEQIVSEAVLYAGKILVERMRGELPGMTTRCRRFMNTSCTWQARWRKSISLLAIPLTIVAVEAAGASERISLACREVYAQIEAVLQEKLLCCGLSNSDAAERARLTLGEPGRRDHPEQSPPHCRSAALNCQPLEQQLAGNLGSGGGLSRWGLMWSASDPR